MDRGCSDACDVYGMGKEEYIITELEIAVCRKTKCGQKWINEAERIIVYVDVEEMPFTILPRKGSIDIPRKSQIVMSSKKNILCAMKQIAYTSSKTLIVGTSIVFDYPISVHWLLRIFRLWPSLYQHIKRWKGKIYRNSIDCYIF